MLFEKKKRKKKKKKKLAGSSFYFMYVVEKKKIASSENEKTGNITIKGTISFFLSFLSFFLPIRTQKKGYMHRACLRMGCCLLFGDDMAGKVAPLDKK